MDMYGTFGMWLAGLCWFIIIAVGVFAFVYMAAIFGEPKLYFSYVDTVEDLLDFMTPKRP